MARILLITTDLALERLLRDDGHEPATREPDTNSSSSRQFRDLGERMLPSHP